MTGGEKSNNKPREGRAARKGARLMKKGREEESIYPSCQRGKNDCQDIQESKVVD